VPWFHELIVRFGFSLYQARLITVGPVGDSVVCNGIEQVLIEVAEPRRVLLPLKTYHRLEGRASCH
jgi:hypothetical protein